MTKQMDFAVKILSQINEMFNDEDCENYIEKEELIEFATEFMHAFANTAPNLFYNKLTGEERNVLEFNHTANQLCFQFATKKD